MDAVRLVTGLLVTFVALVLGLQLSEVKASFDTAYRDRGLDAAHLAQLDQCLRNYGADAETARTQLKSYTAAVIASTWPDEPQPTSIAYPDPAKMARVGESQTLAALINAIGIELSALRPTDPRGENIAAECRSDYADVLTGRWTVIEDAHGSVSPLFSAILTFWLMLVFLSFGLQAPRKRLGIIVMAIGVVAISSVMFVIADLNIPYGGSFGVPSGSMRNALADMMK